MNNTKKITQGVISAHPKGFGFVTAEDLSEHFVPPSLMKRFIPGDEVHFEVEPGKMPGSTQVREAFLVNRPPSVWVGTVRNDRGILTLDPDHPCFVRLQLTGVHFVPSDTVVSVRVAGTGERLFQPAVPNPYEKVTLERVLGPRSAPNFDADYVLARNDFELFFSRKVLDECSKLPAEVTVPSSHKDLTTVPFVTIDGASTRDFDDALFAEDTPEGWKVSVAIADVSYYVRPRSALNDTAFKRGTSVYLPTVTVPMLPEELSNGLCSLLPGKTRLAVVLEMSVTREGVVTGSSVTRAAICSAKRLTYEDAQSWHDLGQAVDTESPNVSLSLKALWAVYEQLARNRQDRGQLEFNDSEPKLVRNEDGSSRLEWATRTTAHKVVEELMLLANQCVALRLQQQGTPALFRHQPEPLAEDWDRLSLWAEREGAPLPETPSMKALADLIAKTGGENPLRAELQVRDSMQPAQYVSKETAHFSLGYAAYTHFTSPIRRYADLTVHRLLLAEAGVTAEKVPAIAAQCSKRSRDARMAERFVWDKLKKRELTREAATESFAGNFKCHVVNQSARGVRIVANDWQCTLFVSAAELVAAGYAYIADQAGWVRAGVSLEQGSLLSVRLGRVEEDRSRLELHGELVHEG